MKSAILFCTILILGAAAPLRAQELTVNAPFDASTYKPLTGKERWQRWVREDITSASIHVQSVGAATYLQVFESPETWDRNWGGYAHRLASSYGVNLVQNTTRESLAAAMHYDPRYFPCNRSGFFHRSWHVFEMSILTHNDEGRLRVDLPQIAGIYGSTMTQMLWMPKHYSPLVQGVQQGHIEAGFTGAEHFVQEFSPELKHMLPARWRHLWSDSREEHMWP